MDKLDVQIFGALVHDRQASPAQSGIRIPIRKIGIKFGIDEDTVRKRIEKMRQSGFLRGWALFPNPNAFGLKGAEIWMDVDSDKSKAIHSFLKIPGVVTVVDMLGAGAVIVQFREQTRSAREVLHDIEGKAKVTNLDFLEMQFPPCREALSNTDIKICRILQINPLFTYKEIAEKTGITTRTARRRVARMIEGNALFLQPSMNAKALEGVVWTDILVFYKSAVVKPLVDKQVAELAGDWLLRAELNNPNHGFFTIFLPNITMTQEIFEAINRKYVTRLRMGLVREFIDSYKEFKKFTTQPRTSAN
jgi:DNA-binding Lrp family transcriptional regulator